MFQNFRKLDPLLKKPGALRKLQSRRLRLSCDEADEVLAFSIALAASAPALRFLRTSAWRASMILIQPYFSQLKKL